MIDTAAPFVSLRFGVRQVKGCWRPAADAVTFSAGLSTEQPGMERRISVTISALGRGTLKNIVLVAVGTSHIHMRTFQFEIRKIMIKGGWLPGTYGMTGSTILSKFTSMLVILGVTGSTLLRGTLEDFIFMAIRAFRLGMFSEQFKIRQIMVKSGWLPGRSFMTGRAIRSKVTLMGVILQMAGITIRGKCFKIRGSLCIQVTFLASQALMLAIQLESRPIVVIIFVNAFHAIMTFTAGWPIILGVGWNKSSVHFLMTTAAQTRIKTGDIIRMTIGAGEGLTI